MSEKIRIQAIVKAVARETGADIRDVARLLKEFIAVIEEGLQRDGQVRIKGLGLFRLRWVDERIGHNPQTGEELTIPGHNRVLFRAEKSLRDRVNRPYAHLQTVILDDPPPHRQTEETEQPVSEPLAAPMEPDAMVEPQNRRSISRSETQKRSYLPWLAAAAAALILLLLLCRLPQQKQEQPAPNPQPETMVARAVEIPLASAQTEGVATTFALDREDKIEQSDHSVAPGDNLWKIAAITYGNPYCWPVIFAANRPPLEDPDRLAVGITLQMPTLEGDGNELSKTDSMLVSAGYLSVFEAYRHKGKTSADYRTAAGRYTGQPNSH
ncbi:HU family DNA-binding protein [candidate division KSB1 bacterium]|nr:HU family DNA-binding protein [candidate division KSB1 bacterium]